MAPLTTGASVPFSDEYRVRQTNMSLLSQLAKLEPTGGSSGGLLTEPLDQQSFEEIVKNANTFRGGLPRARSMQDIWPWCLLLASVCLFADIFVRRVSLDYAYPAKWMLKKLRPGATLQDAARQQSLNQLRSKKSQVSEAMEQQRATTRFEATGPTETSTLEEAASGKSALTSEAPRTVASNMASKDEEGGYTSRLLAAKKAAQKRTGNNE